MLRFVVCLPLLWNCACDRSAAPAGTQQGAAPAPPTPPVSSASASRSAPPQEGPAVSAAAQPLATPALTVASAEARLQQVASGEASLEELVKEERGLVLARYHGDASGENPAANADGIVKQAEHVCGEELRQKLRDLSRDLAQRRTFHRQHGLGAETFLKCEQRGEQVHCRHKPRMEFDVGGTYAFVSDEGKPTLVSVGYSEAEVISEGARAEAEAWLDGQIAALAEKRCSPS